jgi:transcriptional regulator GlxA family with amidase domain
MDVEGMSHRTDGSPFGAPCPRQARPFLDRAARLIEPVAGTGAQPTKRSPTGLSPWQERKVLRYIEEHLSGAIRNRDLAEITGLSVGHFARRFRGSFGVSPHEYVIHSRLEHAKTLIRRTRSPLCQIALASGFSDQAHLSRTFHAMVGDTPTRWRREQTGVDRSLGRSGPQDEIRMSPP